MLQGKLRRLSTGEYFFEQDNGDVIDITFRLLPNRAEKTPLNVRIGLAVDEDGIVSGDRWYVALKDEHPASINDTVKHVLIAYMAPTDATDDDMAKLLVRAQRRAREVEAFYKWCAGYKWDIRMEGYAFRTALSGISHGFAMADLKPAYAANPIEGFFPNYWHSVGGIHNLYCGQATLGGRQGGTYKSRGMLCGLSTTIHELGHNFGLLHGRKLAPDGDIIEYGDPTTVMGNSKSRQGFNAPNYLTLQLADEKDIVEVSQNSNVLLAPLELNSPALRPNEDQILIIRGSRPNNDLTIHTRSNKGAYSLNTAFPHLYIHQNTKPSSLLLGSLRERQLGEEETFITEEGIEVAFLSSQDETCLVNVTFPNDKTNPATPDFPEGFPQAPVTTVPHEDFRGAWYDPDQDYQGFHIHIKDGRIGLIWYTYDSRLSTNRRFHTATAELSDAANSMDLYTTVMGTFDDPQSSRTVLLGTCQLYFLDGATAIFNFNTTEHGRGSIELTKLTHSIDPADGWYYDPERNGEGFGLLTIAEDRKILYWYTYLNKRPFAGGSMQEWYFIDFQQSDTGELYRASGGEFMKQTNSAMVPIGSAVLRQRANEIQVTYNIDGTLEGVRNCIKLF